MFTINKEKRQYLNLSAYADSVLRNDGEVYGWEKGSLLNRVIERFKDRARASVSLRLAEKEKELDEGFMNADEDFPIPLPYALWMKDFVLSEYERELAGARDYPKEVNVGWDIRLSEENAAYIYGKEPPCPEEKYYKRGGDYVKALLEEYCRLSPLEREAVLFSKEIAFIEDAVEKHLLLKVSTGGKAYEIRAFGVLPDSQYRYHYLVGLSRPAGTKEPETAASFRLSRIDHRRSRTLSPNNNRSGRLRNSEKKQLTGLIAARGVMFLLDRTKNVYIRLTEEGRRMYERKLNLRPALSAPGPSSEFAGRSGVFLCSGSLSQIEYYFFDFGAEAEILSPKDLRDKFAEKYRRALEAYEGDALGVTPGVPHSESADYAPPQSGKTP